MKEKFDLIVVLPIGPNCKIEYIEDTINSIKHYCLCPLKIIASDDSQKDTGVIIKSKFPDIDILKSQKNYGLYGGLYVTLSLAFKYAIYNYSFKVCLRMDTDALITGFNPQQDAISFFEQNPNAGIAGLHRAGKYPRDFTGNHIDNWWPRNQIMTFAFTWKLIRRPLTNWTMRKIVMQAFKNGYEIGENIFGGAYFVSELFLISLDKAGLLPNFNMKSAKIEEDHIFSMMAKYIGYDLGDMESGDKPFGVAWKGLPASPEDLHKHNKKIIHSTRYWNDMKEPEIRRFFKEKRMADLNS